MTDNIWRKIITVIFIISYVFFVPSLSAQVKKPGELYKDIKIFFKTDQISCAYMPGKVIGERLTQMVLVWQMLS